MARHRPRKVAVIGAAGFAHTSSEAQVECFSWNRLKRVTNLADYDIVILNLLSIDASDSLDVSAFRQILDIQTVQQVLSKTESAIFVFGDPRFALEWEEDHIKHEEPLLTWTGFDFHWDGRPGTTVEWEKLPPGPFERFVDKLARWDYSLVACRPNPKEFAKVWDFKRLGVEDEEPKVLLDKICTNSYGNSLVFSVAHGVEFFPDRNSQLLGSKRTVPLSNPIFFLPESQLTEEETLEFILRDLCGVEVSAPEPEWIAEFAAPGQKEIDDELSELDIRINKLIEEYNRKIEERDEARKPLKLLYETGAALEEAVRSVLEALGAKVEWPREDQTQEDGWITVRVGDETFEGVLEIKGVKGKHFDLQGVRQLTDWIERGISLRKKTYTGIFVGNSSREDPPRRRIWPFNKNWIEYAEMRGYAGIRTEDLYVLYLLDQTGRLDRDTFWRGLFMTKGFFDSQLFWKKLTDEEKDQLGNLPQV